MNAPFVALMLVLIGTTVFAEQPEVGKKAAAKYFQKNSPRGGEAASYTNTSDERRARRGPAAEDEGSAGASSHYLQLHFGRFVGSQAWEWGQSGRVEEAGEYTLGVTYKFDQWGQFADVNLRVDFIEYKVVGQRPQKMSMLPLVIFPDSGSRFPLYFGAGAGLGVFFKQVGDESTLSLDYQLVAGARFFDVFENGGFFIETGLKNHIQLLNSGQFNGTFLSVGALFTF